MKQQGLSVMRDFSLVAISIFHHSPPFYFTGKRFFSKANYGNLAYFLGGPTASQDQQQIMNEVLQSYPLIEQKIILVKNLLINSTTMLYILTAFIILFVILIFRITLNRYKTVSTGA
ncbi:MAG: hypothetical protein QW597_00665 [Thermoplasmataceae archaeon]